MSNEWEVVVKGGKHKLQSQMTKNERKKLEDNKMVNNKYQFGNAGDEEDTDKSQSPVDYKLKSKNKSKKKTGNSGKESIDILKLLSNLQSEELKKIFKELSDKFPNNYAIILTDLALRIDLLLSAEVNQNHFNQLDFPMSYLSKSALSVIHSIMNQLSNDQLFSFVKQSIHSLCTEVDNDSISIGNRILLQIGLKNRPTILITERKQFFELFNTFRDHTVKFKQLLWALKQSCVNINIASQLWLMYLLPFITQKCHAETVLQFGEQLETYQKIKSTSNDTKLLVTDFIPVLELLFGSSNELINKKSKKKPIQPSLPTFQLNEQQLMRLRNVYVKVKDVAFKSNTTNEYFASLFVRLAPKSANDQLNIELLNCLDLCLLSDMNTIEQLSQLHVKYPCQTTLLLKHLQSDKTLAANVCKSNVYKRVSKSIYKSTLGSPVGSSKDAVHQMTQPQHNSSSYCSTILISLVYFLFFMSFVGFVAKKQYPNEFELAREKIQPYVDQVSIKLAPLYKEIEIRSNWAYEKSLPYIQDGLDWIKVKSQQAYIVTEPYIHDIVISMENLGKVMNEYLRECMKVINNTFDTSLKALQSAYVDFQNYLNSPKFQLMVKSTRETVQFYFDNVINYLTNMLLQVKKSMGY